MVYIYIQYIYKDFVHLLIAIDALVIINWYCAYFSLDNFIVTYKYNCIYVWIYIWFAFMDA